MGKRNRHRGRDARPGSKTETNGTTERAPGEVDIDLEDLEDAGEVVVESSTLDSGGVPTEAPGDLETARSIIGGPVIRVAVPLTDSAPLATAPEDKAAESRAEDKPAEAPKAEDKPAEAKAEDKPAEAPKAAPPKGPAPPPPPTKVAAKLPTAEAIEAIAERLRAGRCVLCVGQGFEADLGMPSFRQMLGQLLGSVGKGPEVSEARKILDQRPFVAAGFVRRRLAERFAGALREASQAPASLPEDVKLLGELPFRAIITTSYSDLFPRAFTRDGTPPPVYTPMDVAELKRDSRKRFVLMALGDPNRDETVLFTSQDIQVALSSDAYRRVLHDIYRQRSIVFLGFSAADIEPFFGRLFAGATAESVHYAIIPGLSSIEAEELAATFRMSTVDEADLHGMVKKLREAIGDFDAEAPPDDDDLEGWIDVLAHEPGRADALDKLNALESALIAKGDHERLLELHLGLAEVETSSVMRADHLREVANIFETHIGDLGRAFTALAAAYKESPISEIASEMERLAQATGMWTELLREYSAIAPSLPQDARASHWVRVARLYSDKLNHAEYALAAIGESLKCRPDFTEAEDLRIEILRREQSWKALSEALAARASHETSPSVRADLHLEQGDILESRLSDGPSAAKAYRRALDAEPGNPEALAALEMIHRRRGDFGQLLGVIDQRVRGLSADEAIRLRKEAASIAADKLGDRKEAIERYESLRADDDSDLMVLKALEALYDSEGRVDDYFDVLARQAEVAKDDRERLALYRRLSAEWEARPGGLGRAADYLEKLLVLEPHAEDALRAVERIYALEKKWEALVDAYRRHAELPGSDRLTLCSYIAQVLETEVKDPQRAIDAWTQVVELAPEEDAGLAALTRLYRQLAAWPRVLELLGKRAEMAKEKEAKVALLYEAATVTAEKIGDVKAAETAHARTLGIDPTHVPSMLALVELYRKAGDFLRAAKLLVDAEGHTQNRLEKTRILVEAGEIYDGLEDRTQAAELYLKALAVDPEHFEAGTRVAELLTVAERWSDLVPVLEMLTRKEADKETQRQRWLRLGRAALKCEQKEKALKALTKAAELDPTDLEAQNGRAGILFADGKWGEAREAFQAVLHHHRDELLSRELLELFYHLGECDRHLGQIGKAKNFYAKALEIDPTHRPTILAQIDVGTDDPKQLIEAKKALIATASRDEKFQLFTQIGDIYLEKLSSPVDALAAYDQAVEVKPDARSLLHKCLELFVEQKDWQRAVETLERLTTLEQEPSVRAKLRFTQAMIHNEELPNEETVIRLLTEAIDDDPDATQAPRELEAMLVAGKNWKELERFLRRAIKRMDPDVDTDTPERRKERLRVWSRLAEISLEHLNEPMTGLASLEVAASLDPDNLQRKEQLAELYVEAGPDMIDKAIDAQQELLRLQHDRISAYRMLRQLYGESQQEEKALAVAYALSFLKKGDLADAPMVAEAKQRPLAPARRNLDDDTWQRLVVHPDEDRFVDGLFTLVMPFVAAAQGKSHKDAGINRRDKVDPADPRSFAKGLRYVAAVLDARLTHECYVRPDQAAAVSLIPCVDRQLPVPCLVVGQPFVGEKKRGEREMIYDLAKVIAHLRPERYLRLAVPQPTSLSQIIDAAVALGGEAEGAKGEVGRKAQELKRALPPKILEQVVGLGRRLKGQRGDEVIGRWLAATELTATRAAFLMIGDLEQTARLLVADPPSVSTHSVKHRLMEVLWYSVTEECFAARQHLGMM